MLTSWRFKFQTIDIWRFKFQHIDMLEIYIEKQIFLFEHKSQDFVWSGPQVFLLFVVFFLCCCFYFLSFVYQTWHFFKLKALVGCPHCRRRLFSLKNSTFWFLEALMRCPHCCRRLFGTKKCTFLICLVFFVFL